MSYIKFDCFGVLAVSCPFSDAVNAGYRKYD